MILYHGSNVEVREPRLLKVQRELDFGKGFYTTSDLEQAAKWAKRTALRLHRKDSYISVYEVDETEMSHLRMLRFNTPDVEWLRFVVKNRKGEPIPVDWDIVSGPVADDRTASVIDLYLDGMYDEEETIKRLLPQKLKDQYTFKTEEALVLLNFRGGEPSMTRMRNSSLDYYNKNVIQRIMDKYGMAQMEAARTFLTSETHSMLENADLAMWEFSERAIFDMWESERVTGDPRNSAYLRSE